MTGDSGEDAIKLMCTAIVVEDVMLSSYQFTWNKDATPIDISNDRIVVCMYECIKCLYGCFLWLYICTCCHTFYSII